MRGKERGERMEKWHSLENKRYSSDALYYVHNMHNNNVIRRTLLIRLSIHKEEIYDMRVSGI